MDRSMRRALWFHIKEIFAIAMQLFDVSAATEMCWMFFLLLALQMVGTRASYHTHFSCFRTFSRCFFDLLRWKTRFPCTRENESRLKRCSVIRRTHSRWRLLQINHDQRLIRNVRSAFCDVIFVSSETAKSIEELVNCIDPNRHTSHRLPHAFDFFRFACVFIQCVMSGSSRAIGLCMCVKESKYGDTNGTKPYNGWYHNDT